LVLLRTMLLSRGGLGIPQLGAAVRIGHGLSSLIDPGIPEPHRYKIGTFKLAGI